MDLPTGFRVTADDDGVYVRLPEVEVTSSHVFQPVLTKKDVRLVAEWIESRLLLLPIRVTVFRPHDVDTELADDFADKLETALAMLKLGCTMQVVSEGRDGDEPATPEPEPSGPPQTEPPAPESPPLPPAPIPSRRRRSEGSQER